LTDQPNISQIGRQLGIQLVVIYRNLLPKGKLRVFHLGTTQPHFECKTHVSTKEVGREYE